MKWNNEYDKLEKESNLILELLLTKTRELLQLNIKVISEALDYLLKEEVLTGQEFREMISKLTESNK